MYQDVNGKRGTRGLVGTSGVTYGNLKLLTPDERAAALADGITEVTPTPPAPPSPERLERQRKRIIRGIAAARIQEAVIGTGEEGDDRLTEVLVDLMEAVVDNFRDLKTKGLMVNADFNARTIAIKDKVVLLRQVSQAKRDAIQNNSTVEEAQAAIDLIIPPSLP